MIPKLKHMRKILIITMIAFSFGSFGLAQSSTECTNGNKDGDMGAGGILEIIGDLKNWPQNVLDIVVRWAIDPNEIIGPEGYGQRRMVSSDMQMPYTILFENDPDFATASAQIVMIRQAFAPHTDISSFQLGNFGFGEYIFEVPEGLNHYQKRLDLRDSLDIYLNITAGVDIINQELFWVFESLDPNTGQLPDDPNTGFLPINDSIIHNGEGFVTYTIKPSENVVTGDSIYAKASIVFDTNAPIETNTVYNIVDAVSPTGLVMEEFTVINDTLYLVWEANDDEQGSGVAYTDIYGCNEKGVYFAVARQQETSPVALSYQSNKDYRFFSVSTDHVGNIEDMKNMPDMRILEEGKNHAPILRYQFTDTILAKNTPMSALNTVIADHFMDEDNDELTYDVIIQNEGLDSVNIKDESLTVYPTKGNLENIVIDVTAKDPSDAIATGSLMLSFKDIDTAPEKGLQLKDTTAWLAKPFIYQMPIEAFVNYDQYDVLEYSLLQNDDSQLPEWLSFDPNNIQLSGIPGINDTGALDLKLIATDTTGTEAINPFALEIINTNKAPVLYKALLDTVAYVGERFTYLVPYTTFIDENEGDTLIYALSLKDGNELPLWLSFSNQDFLLSGTPEGADIGNDTILVTVSDQYNIKANDYFVIHTLMADGVSELAIGDNHIQVYPNPVKDYLHIDFERILSNDIYCEIIDVTGNYIYSKSLSNKNNILNLRDLSAGVYVVVLECDNQKYQVKFIKE